MGRLLQTALRSRAQEVLPRSPRISLRRRLRAALRNLAALFNRIIAAQGRPERETITQRSAREEHERKDAIDASVGAMSAADIQRMIGRPSSRD
jgi:hypothetical protein